jgi:SOS-response transcriptional repressor LexA
MIEMQGQYFCAACMFNYTELKDKPDKLNDVLIETMKMEGFGPLFASALYQRVALKSPTEANQYIQQLAQKNNIDVYQGHGFMAKIIGGLLKLFK